MGSKTLVSFFDSDYFHWVIMDENLNLNSVSCVNETVKVLDTILLAAMVNDDDRQSYSQESVSPQMKEVEVQKHLHRIHQVS